MAAMNSGATVVLVMVLVAITGIKTSAQTLPNCPDRCGDVKIPYPFGTVEGCYLRDEFFINCTIAEGTINPVAKLRSPPPSSSSPLTDINVTDISLDAAELRVSSCVYRACVNWGEADRVRPKDWIRLPSPFAFSTKNFFFAVGCATFAKFRGYQYLPIGLVLGEGDIEAYNKSGFALTSCDDNLGSSCSGNGCSQSPIYPGLQNFTVESLEFGSYIDYSQRTWYSDYYQWNYGFLAERGNLSFSPNITFPQLQNHETLPLSTVVDWKIGEEPCEVAQKSQTSYACKGNSMCVNWPNVKENAYGGGYICRCLSGYWGNPYLEDGCQDIDECHSSKRCSTEETCVNLPGNYKCVHKKSKEHLWIYISLGTFGFVFVLVFGGLWLIYWRKRCQHMNLKEKYFENNGGLLLLQQLVTRHGVETTKIFTEEELEKATNNYNESRVLGEGGCGIVYKGILPDNRVVAVKKPKVDMLMYCSTPSVHSSPNEQFVNEMIILSQINHINVVRLLGCCLETPMPILVYEFITNGTLHEHIHGDKEGKRKSSPLFWDLRLKIATETAGALAYLHSSTSTPILHRDVKTMNILLDETYTAKVADFGASRLIRPRDEMQMTTLVQGTLGYLDPEYFHSDKFTEKSDVYSFGVVLVELLTSQKAFSFTRRDAERNLSKLFVSSVEGGRLNEILDNDMFNRANEDEKLVIENVADLAKRCLRVKGDERPTMKEVAMELECLYEGLSPMFEMTIKHRLLCGDETTEHLLGSSLSNDAHVVDDVL